jgi:hypothetical protein
MSVRSRSAYFSTFIPNVEVRKGSEKQIMKRGDRGGDRSRSIGFNKDYCETNSRDNKPWNRCWNKPI